MLPIKMQSNQEVRDISCDAIIKSLITNLVVVANLRNKHHDDDRRVIFFADLNRASFDDVSLLRTL